MNVWNRTSLTEIIREGIQNFNSTRPHIYDTHINKMINSTVEVAMNLENELKMSTDVDLVMAGIAVRAEFDLLWNVSLEYIHMAFGPALLGELEMQCGVIYIRYSSFIRM